MEMGLGALGLAPATFWTLTPRELQAALRGKFAIAATGEAPARDEFEALMRRYPD